MSNQTQPQTLAIDGRPVPASAVAKRAVEIMADAVQPLKPVMAHLLTAADAAANRDTAVALAELVSAAKLCETVADGVDAAATMVATLTRHLYAAEQSAADHRTASHAIAPPPKRSAEVEAFIADAAGRIAGATAKALARRAKHAAEDRERFDGWLSEYLSADGPCCRYVQRAVTALVGPEGAKRVAADYAKWTAFDFHWSDDPAEDVADLAADGGLRNAELAISSELTRQENEQTSRQSAA